MAAHSEHALLISAANYALMRALDDGDVKGYKSDWLNTVSRLEHARHALAHTEATLGDSFNDSFGDEADLDHAIFRLVAIKALLIQQRMIKESGN